MSSVDKSTACYVCGYGPHEDYAAKGGHNYWSTADALAEFREYDRRATFRFANGTETVEANYVAEYRPY